MADSDPLPDGGQFSPEVRTAALLFRVASHPMRLAALLELARAERESNALAEALGGLNLPSLGNHLGPLREVALITSHPEGHRNLYSITGAGRSVVAAYSVVRDFLESGSRTDGPADCLPGSPAPSAGGDPAEIDATSPGPAAISAAVLLNHAANPLRLRILLALADGERDTAALGEELADAGQSVVRHAVGVLRSGTLISSQHRGRQHCHALTEAGLALVQVVRSACSRLSIRRGQLTLRPEPIRSRDSRGLDPTSPEGLSCLFRTFADPVRLRILNLLSGAEAVCLCHLEAALGLPRVNILRYLGPPTAAGLVTAREVNDWPHYALSRPAQHLYQGMLGCLGPRLSEMADFRADRLKLKALSPCPDPVESMPVPTEPDGERHKIA